MTVTERAAFEKLYKTFKTRGQGRPKGANGEHDELDQIADEYYEEDEEGSSSSLDKAFDVVLKGAPQTQPQPEKEAPAPDTPQSKKKAAAKAEKDRIKNLRMDERLRIDKMLQAAQTDQQLWDTLEREVFHQLRTLDLDALPANTKGPPKRKAKQQKPTDPTAVDTRILFPNYPHHLNTALQILRTQFPSSPLPFTILSTIKSLGRSSHALGATTQLYRQLLRTAWLQQSSYNLIDTLLTDMDTNIIEFDMGILDLLDAIIKEHKLAKSGALGTELQMVHGMEMWTEGVKKIRAWRGVVAEKLGVREKPRVVRTPAPAPLQTREREQSRHQRTGNLEGASARGGAVPRRIEPSGEIPFVDGGGLETESLEDSHEGSPSQETDVESLVGKAEEEEGSEGDHDADAPAKVLL